VTGRKVPYEVGPRRSGDPAVLVANSDKLKRTLGWTPRFPELNDTIATAWQFENRGAATRKADYIATPKTEFAASREGLIGIPLDRTGEALPSLRQPITLPG